MKYEVGEILKHRLYGYKVKILDYKNGIYRCVCVDNTLLSASILLILEQNLEGICL